MIFEGGKEDWEERGRPIWLIVRDAIGLLLMAVNAIAWPVLAWVVLQ